MERINKNLANMITGIGLIAVILFITFLFKGYKGSLMLFMISIIGITDLLDGAIARGLKIVSQLGKSLDRARDKLFACILFGFELKLLLGRSDIVSNTASAFLIAILLFEFGLIGTWIFGLKKKLDVSAHIWGKRKMWFYFFVAYLFFADSYFVPVFGSNAFNITFLSCLALSALFAFLSLWGYVERFFPSQK